MRTILVVEDELDILENNRKALEDAGYTTLTAASAAAARDILAGQKPDAAILDIMLPDGNGLDLLQEMRSAGSKIPVMMLTAWGKPSDIARGLKLGANDYLSKPFSYEVLLARVEAMFRNAEQMPETMTKGNLTIGILADVVHVTGARLELTPLECSLLRLFAFHEGETLGADYVYEKVWTAKTAGDRRAVQRRVSDLRNKLIDGGSSHTVNTIYGRGYCFEKTD